MCYTCDLVLKLHVVTTKATLRFTADDIKRLWRTNPLGRCNVSFETFLSIAICVVAGEMILNIIAMPFPCLWHNICKPTNYICIYIYIYVHWTFTRMMESNMHVGGWPHLTSIITPNVTVSAAASRQAFDCNCDAYSGHYGLAYSVTLGQD